MTPPVVTRWTRWWNPPTPRWVIEVAAATAPLAAALDVVHHWAWHRHGDAPSVLAGVFGPAGRLGLPRLTAVGFAVLASAIVAAALVAAALAAAALVAASSAASARRERWSRGHRAALAATALGYWWWAAETARYGTPTHARTALVVTLVALALRERAAGTLTSGWPLRVAAAVLAFLYASAGWEKLHLVGSGWWSGGATEAGIVLWGPRWAAHLALDHPGWVHAAALAALVLELLAPVPLLVVTAWRRPAALLAAGFHVLVVVTMGIDFLPMAVVCLLVALAPAHVPADLPAFVTPAPAADLVAPLAAGGTMTAEATHGTLDHPTHPAAARRHLRGWWAVRHRLPARGVGGAGRRRRAAGSRSGARHVGRFVGGGVAGTRHPLG